DLLLVERALERLHRRIRHAVPDLCREHLVVVRAQQPLREESGRAAAGEVGTVTGCAGGGEQRRRRIAASAPTRATGRLLTGRGRRAGRRCLLSRQGGAYGDAQESEKND